MIEGGREVVNCPECRKETTIPSGGVNSMNGVFRLQNLAIKHAQDIALKKAQRSDLCDTHNIRFDYYCKKCNATGCSTCMMEKHRGPDHDTDKLQIVRQQQRERLKIITDRAAEKIDERCQSVEELERRKTRLRERH